MKNSTIHNDETLEDALYEQAVGGKRDGYKNLEAFRRKQALNDAIAEKFGIGVNDEE
jgi:hypothetical protein